MPEYTFWDATIEGGFRGGDLVFLPGGSVALFEREGRIIEYDLAGKREVRRLDDDAFDRMVTRLASPSMPSWSPQVLAVATRAAHFVWWNLADGSFHRLQHRESGPVNCVAFSPYTGDSLLVGVGDYPLSNRSNGAYLEIYRVKRGEPEFVRATGILGLLNRGEAFYESCSNLEFVNSTVLPGVCVDCLAWLNDNEAFCVTGARSQDHGFLIRFRLDPFRILAIRETTSVWARSLFVREGSVIVQYERDIVEFPFSAGEEGEEGNLTDLKFEAPSRLFESKTDLGLSDFDPVSDTLLLTDGTLLDLMSGERKQLLEPLPDCRAIRAKLPFGAVALAGDGVLRCYQKAAEPAVPEHAR